MGRRSNLKDVAYGLLSSFISRNNSVGGYWALGKLSLIARQQGATTLFIDLLCTPDEPLAPEVAEVRAYYASWLRRALKHHALRDGILVRANVRLEFEREDLRAIARAHGYRDYPPFLCQVHLLDDHAAEYVYEAVGACHPHDPALESRSGG